MRQQSSLVRILRIRLHNLNSLRGHHEVDFTIEPLRSATLYAITGATGAGKSTLLDAITLALFGKAARYDKENQVNDMMSRHSGECSSEVLFQTKSGIYRCEWLLHRARKSPDGSLQPVRRFIYDANETPLNRTTTECQQIIEDLIGLDYQRFLRSVLLAQGEFARFLKADANARAELLESLTGTSIYSELGCQVHIQTTTRQRLYAEKNASVAAMAILTDDQRLEISNEISRNQEELKVCTKALEQLRLYLHLTKSITESDREIEHIQKKQTEWSQRNDAFREKSQSLTRHELAQSAQQTILQWRNASTRKAETTDETTKAQKSHLQAHDSWWNLIAQARSFANTHHHSLARDIEQANATIASTEAQIGDCNSWLAEKTHHHELNDALQQLLQLQQSIVSNNQIIDLHRQDEENITREITQSEALLASVQAEIEQIKHVLGENKTSYNAAAQAITPFQVHPNDSPTEIIARINQRENHCIESLRIIEALEKSQEELRAKKEQANHFEEELRQQQLELEKSRHELQLREDHYRLAQASASLQEHRQQLKDDEPCPLCGALHHPYRDPNEIPELSSIETALHLAKSQWQAHNNAHQQLLVKANNCNDNITAIEKAIQSHQDSLGDQTSRQHWQNEKDQCHEQLNLFMELSSNLTNADKLLSETSTRLHQSEVRKQELQSRFETLKTQGTEKKNTREQLQERNISLENNLRDQLTPFQLTLSQPESWSHAAKEYHEITKKREQHAHALAQWQRKLGDLQSQQQELEELTSPWSDLPHTEACSAPVQWTTEEAKHLTTEAWYKKEQTRQRFEWCEDAKNQSEKEYANAGQVLHQTAQELGFAHGEELAAALLPADQATAWNTEKETILSGLQECETLQKAAQERRESLSQQLAQLPQVDEEPQQSLHNQQSRHETLVTQVALKSNQLAMDDSLRSQQSTQMAELAEMAKQLSHWELLHDLIGSHDGSKFRKHAQSVTLTLLLHHANTHMLRLNPRYSMQRSVSGELHLEITDHHQSNTVRPMNSLSGGESFLASLALALALSDIAGRNQAIESLFIDEGFGTLDSDTLDNAISTLETLQQQNKTIGIISHIEMLKERIRVQIHVAKKSGGTSEIRI